MFNIDKLLQGSIDLHMHHGPDTSITGRRVDALEAAQQAEQAGMRAIVLKNHDYTTAPLATIVGKLVPGVSVFGSLCLEYQVGGLNFHALEASAKLGAKVVWMPTFSSTNSRNKVKELGFKLEGDGFSVLDKDGELVPEIDRILQIVKDYDIVLASGHISVEEAFALVEKARHMDIWKLIITHPLSAQVLKRAFTLEELARLAKMGAFIEFTAIDLMPSDFGEHDPAPMVEVIKTIGAERCILSTDLGQYKNPPPAEGMRIFIATLLTRGVAEREIELMARENPAKLLGLD